MRIIGWKAGFGSAAAMERLGTTAPLFGLLTDATLLEPGATVPLEPELAIYLDSGGGIAAVGAAIELVDLRTQTDDPAEILAGNIYHRHVLLGRERANSPDGLTAKVHRDGELVAETDDPQALNGRLDDVVRLLHETVGDRVRPGDVVIAGSVVAPIAIALGQQIRYDLAPLGSLTVLLR
jgi:2-keto-4-pentenoate hydratase